MNASGILSVIDGIKSKLEKNPQLIGNNAKILEKLEEARNELKDKEIPDNLMEVYQSLIKKGKELNSSISATANAKELKNKTLYYIRYINAVIGDINGEVNRINVYYRWFLFTSILFLVLSPQWFGFLLPALFFVPIFLGIKGVRQRGVNGFYMSLTISPIGFMTGVLWVRNGWYSLNNYAQSLSEVMTQTGFGEGMANALVIVPPILGLLLVISAVLMSYYGYRARKLFV